MDKMTAAEQVELWEQLQKEENMEAIKQATRAINGSYGEKWTAEDDALLEALMLKLRRNISKCELAGNMREDEALQYTKRTYMIVFASAAVLWRNGAKGQGANK